MPGSLVTKALGQAGGRFRSPVQSIWQQHDPRTIKPRLKTMTAWAIEAGGSSFREVSWHRIALIRLYGAHRSSHRNAFAWCWRAVLSVSPPISLSRP